MHSFNRLSIITGYELNTFGEIINIDTPITPDKEVSPLHLVLLCRAARKPMKPESYILVSEDNCFYRGVILENVFENRRGIYGSHIEHYITIAYKGAEGKREIIKMSPNGSSGFFDCLDNQSIRAYSIDFAESLFNNKEQPINEEYEVIEQYDVVSVGHNSNGFFFMNQNNSRISVYLDNIQIDSSGCFVIEKDSFFGLADNYGKVILDPKYFIINPFSEGLAAFLSYKAWGFVNIDGNTVIAPQYETAENFNNGISKVSICGERIGFINKAGNGVIIKDSYVEFPEYCFVAQEGDIFYGCLHGESNIKGRWKKFSIPALNSNHIITQKTCNCIFLGDCLITEKDGHKYLYSYSGNVSNKVDDCNLLGYCKKYNIKSRQFDGPIVGHIIIKDLPFYYIVSCGNKKGVINNSGVIIVPIEYEYIGLLSSQVILAYNGAGMRLFSTNPATKDTPFGETFTQPYELIEKIEEAYDSKTELNQFYVYKTKKVGKILFEDGVFKTIFPCIYDRIGVIDGIRTETRILGQDGNYTEKPKDLSWMTPFSYSGIAVALKEDHFGLIDSHYHTLRDYSYDTIFKIDAFHYLLSKDNHVELVRFNKVLVESVIMEFPGLVVSRLSSFVFRILKSGKYFVFKYDTETEEFSTLIEQGYDDVVGIGESFIVVQENGLFGCYDNDGHKVLDIKYDSIVPIKHLVWGFQGPQPSNQTVHQIIVGYYPVDKASDYLCDLYNIKSRNLLHISSSLLFDDSSKKYHENNDSSLPIVAYVSESKYSKQGPYILLGNGSYHKYIASIDCQRLEGPFDEIKPFGLYSGLSTYNNGKHGLIELDPFDVIPCEFDHPVSFVDHGSRFWIINKSIGKESKKVVYDSIKKQELDLGHVISIESMAEGIYGITVLTENGHKKCGLFDRSFKQIVPLVFDSIDKGKEGQFIVKKGNREGIIDETGTYIYPLTLGRIDHDHRWNEDAFIFYYLFYDENGFLYAVSNDGYILNDIVDCLHGGFIPNSNSHFISARNENGKFTVYTSFGVKYTDVEDTYTENGVTILKTTDGSFAINSEKRITPSLHEVITINKRLAYLSVKDGQHRQFYGFNGESLGEIEGDYVGCILNKEAGVFTTISRKDDDRLSYNLLSLEGKTIIDMEFSYIGSFHENYATCVINSENPIDKEFFKEAQEESFFAFNKKNYGKWGVINNKGEIVIPMIFDYIRPVKNGLTIYVKDGKYGLINLIDNYRTAPVFKYLFTFSEGLCAFRDFVNESDGIWMYKMSDCGLINEKGQRVVPTLFNKIYSFKDGVATVESRDHFVNIIDHDGNLLHEWKELPAKEDSYDDYYEGYTQSELEDMYRAAFEGDPSSQWNID